MCIGSNFPLITAPVYLLKSPTL